MGKQYFLTANMFYYTEKCQWTLLAIEVLFIYHWNCVMIFFAIIHLPVLEYWHLKSVYLLKLKRRAHFLPLSCQGIYNVTNLQSNLVDRKSLQSNYDASMKAMLSIEFHSIYKSQFSSWYWQKTCILFFHVINTLSSEL